MYQVSDPNRYKFQNLAFQSKSLLFLIQVSYLTNILTNVDWKWMELLSFDIYLLMLLFNSFINIMFKIKLGFERYIKHEKSRCQEKQILFLISHLITTQHNTDRNRVEQPNIDTKVKYSHKMAISFIKNLHEL